MNEDFDCCMGCIMDHNGEVLYGEITFKNTNEVISFVSICLENGIDFSLWTCDPEELIEDTETEQHELD